MSQKSKAVTSTGKIVSIISGEIQNIDWGVQMAPYIVIAPFSTIFAFSLIAINFKEAAVIGFVAFCFIIASQMLLSKVTLKWRYAEGSFSDKRIDIVSSAVNGLRTIKTYCWENQFFKLCQKYRNSQLVMIFKGHTIN